MGYFIIVAPTMRFDLGRMFANAVLRRLAFVLVALVLGCVGVGRADAAPICGLITLTEALSNAGMGAQYADRGLAMAACQSMPSELITTGGGGGWYARGVFVSCTANADNTITSIYRDTTSFPDSNCTMAYATDGYLRNNVGWAHAAICVAPEVWNDALKTCFNPSEFKPEKNNECPVASLWRARLYENITKVWL